jgi:hypothetical protein
MRVGEEMLPWTLREKRMKHRCWRKYEMLKEKEQKILVDIDKQVKLGGSPGRSFLIDLS